MKDRRHIILLIVAIAIAAIVLIIEDPRRSRVDDVGEGTFSPGFDGSKVERVEISRLLEGTQLRRDGERWLVSDLLTPLREELVIREGRTKPGERWFRADRTRVKSSLGSFGGLQEGVIASTNREKRSLYQVDATGLRVKLLGGNGEVIEDLIIGKNGPDLASSFVRRTDEDEVYLVRRSLAGVFAPTASSWRKRKLWLLKPEEIEMISVSSNGRSFEMKRGTHDEFASIAKALSRVQAEGFPKDPNVQPGRKTLELKLWHGEAEPLILRIYERNVSGLFPARLEGVEETYLLSEEFVKSIPKNFPEER